MFQDSLVISSFLPLAGLTAAAMEEQSTKRLMDGAFAAASSAFRAPAIELVITTLGSLENEVSDDT